MVEVSSGHLKSGLGGSGGMGLVRRGKLPGQELVYAVDGVVANLLQDRAEIEFRIESVRLRRSDEAVDGGRALAAVIALRGNRPRQSPC